MKKFNVKGLCCLEENYMVDMNIKIAKIKNLVSDRIYFSAGNTPKCGKSTVLAALARRLKHQYTVVSVNFNQPGSDYLISPENFCREFIRQVADELNFISSDKEYIKKWADCGANNFISLSSHIGELCRNKKVVLIIDNADITNEIFTDFLVMLGAKYMFRENGGEEATFHSVVLAEASGGKNTELPEKINNPPWNTMRDYGVDMAFNAAEIAGMLREYEADHNTGMNIAGISEEIFTYTSGYLYLVSMLCRYIDEYLDKDWTLEGIDSAMSLYLKENH